MTATIVLQARLIRPELRTVIAPPTQTEKAQKIAFTPRRFEPIGPGSRLIIPVEGVTRADLVDTWEAARSEGRTHKGIDIMAPEGAEVRAVADGKIAKLFFSERGGITIYQTDATGRFVFYYAHLHDYETGLREGDEVKQGQRIAFVGSTGNATTPHLHLEIEAASPDGKWWKGVSFDPYPSLMAGEILIPALSE